MFRTNVNEVDVEPINLGDELRQSVEPRLDIAPVVAGLPVLRELLHSGQLHALGLIGHGLLVGPLRCGDASAETAELLLRNGDVERPYRVGVALCSKLAGQQTNCTRGYCGGQNVSSRG